MSHKSEGVPAWAVVLVNRGAAGGSSESTSLVTLTARALPDGPEGTVRGDVRAYQAVLMTHGMRIPVLCDPATGTPRGLMTGHLDEAIGRHYQQLEPQRWTTWQEALDAKRREFTRGQFTPSLGLGDVRGAVKDLPGGLRSMFREITKVRRGTVGRAAARVTAIEPTPEQAGGMTVYAMTVVVMDSPAGRTVAHRQPLSDARAATLASSGYAEVTFDPADPERITI